MPRSAIAGSYSSCMISFFKKLQTCFLKNLLSYVKNLDLIVRALGGHFNINPNFNILNLKSLSNRRICLLGRYIGEPETDKSDLE